MNQIKFKSFKFDFKNIDTKGQFSGYASVFGNEDSNGDVVDPGAFKRTLDHHKGHVPILWQHNSSMPIGVGKSAQEDHKGLRIEGELNMDIRQAVEARSLMQQGAIKGLSIGYSVVKDIWDSTTKTTHLKELKLWEYSPVTFPANVLAGVENIKSLDNVQIKALLDEIRRQGLGLKTNSDSELNSLMSVISKIKNYAMEG